MTVTQRQNFIGFGFFGALALGYAIFCIRTGVFEIPMRGFEPITVTRRRAPVRFWTCIIVCVGCSGLFFYGAWRGDF